MIITFTFSTEPLYGQFWIEISRLEISDLDTPIITIPYLFACPEIVHHGSGDTNFNAVLYCIRSK